jgi:hypothetical protein
MTIEQLTALTELERDALGEIRLVGPDPAMRPQGHRCRALPSRRRPGIRRSRRRQCAGAVMNVAVNRDIEELIDNWRRPRGLTRPEAVRRLVLTGLRRSAARNVTDPDATDPELVASLA